MPCLPVPICIRRRLPVENFPQHKSREEVCPFTEKKAANQRKKAYLSKDKPCILKKTLEWRVRPEYRAYYSKVP